MGKLPTVTIGTATAARSPTATFGTATGVGAPTLIAVRPPSTQNLTLAQVLQQGNQGDNAPLVITELNARGKTIKLFGRAAPYRGSLKFVSMQRIAESEYIGYPRVSQTALGGREQDTEMNGAWKDRFLGDDEEGTQALLEDFVPEGVSVPAGTPLSSLSKLVSARDLCKLFEDLAYSGTPIALNWRHIRRTGRLEKFEQNWITPHDVEWKMTWKWISRDEKVHLPSPARTTLTGLAAEFRSAATDLHDATNFDGIDALDPSFADRVDYFTGRIEGAIADIGDAIETRLSAVTDLHSSLRRAASIATFVRDQAQELIDSLDAITYPAMIAAQDPSSIVPAAFSFDALSQIDLGQTGRLVAPLVGVDAGAALAAACQNRAAAQLARKMRHVAARQQFALIRQLEADSIGVVIIRDDQDLRDIALQWYGNPDDWEPIRRFNELDTLSPPAGTMLYIPNQAGTR